MLTFDLYDQAVTAMERLAAAAREALGGSDDLDDMLHRLMLDTVVKTLRRRRDQAASTSLAASRDRDVLPPMPGWKFDLPREEREAMAAEFRRTDAWRGLRDTFSGIVPARAAGAFADAGMDLAAIPAWIAVSSRSQPGWPEPVEGVGRKTVEVLRAYVATHQ